MESTYVAGRYVSLKLRSKFPRIQNHQQETSVNNLNAEACFRLIARVYPPSNGEQDPPVYVLPYTSTIEEFVRLRELMLNIVKLKLCQVQLWLLTLNRIGHVESIMSLDNAITAFIFRSMMAARDLGDCALDIEAQIQVAEINFKEDIAEQLQTVVYSYGCSGNADDVCAICLDSFQGGMELKKMPSCGHFFHDRCIMDWLVVKLSCPICRSTLAIP